MAPPKGIFRRERLFNENWSVGRLLSRDDQSEKRKVLTDKNIDACLERLKLPSPLSADGSRVAEKIIAEVQQVLRHLDHRNLLLYDHASLDEKESTVEVLMELIDDNLKPLETFVNGAAQPEGSIKLLTHQICSALDYLHGQQMPVLHRNINHQTIMIAPGTLQLKLTDFGLARLLDGASHHGSSRRGEINFLAPELIGDDEAAESIYSTASDVWALGCVVYFMSTGMLPHAGCKNMRAIANKIVTGAPDLTGGSQHLVCFYRSCVAQQRKDRGSAAALMKHKFLASQAAASDEASAEPAVVRSAQAQDILYAKPHLWTDEELTAECQIEDTRGNATQDVQYGALKETLLTIAAKRGRADLVGLLLKRGSPETLVKARDVLGMTALSWAAAKGHSGVLEVFVAPLPSELVKVEANSRNNMQQTPIILAAKNGHAEALERLCKMEGDVNSQDELQCSALTYAAMSGLRDVASKLLALGANPMLLDSYDNSPLIWAARCGHLDVLHELSACLTDVRHWSQSGECGRSALEWAKYCKHRECAEYIEARIMALQSSNVSDGVKNWSFGGGGGNQGPSKPTGPSSESLGSDEPFHDPQDPSGSGKPPQSPQDPPGRPGEPPQDSSSQDASGPGNQPSQVPCGPGNKLSLIVQPPDCRYPMLKPWRGFAWIVNIMNFPPGTGLTRRDGSEADVQQHRLPEAFGRLGFDVVSVEDVGKDFFDSLLENLQNTAQAQHSSCEDCFTDCDAFLLCLMSHGILDHIYASDGERVLLDSIFAPVRKCSGLSGKPKIFVIQSCREIPERTVIHMPPVVEDEEAQRYDDCLKIYSVVRGTGSFRDESGGAYFTKALAEAIRNDFDYESQFATILPGVTSRVAQRSTNRQTASYSSTLKGPLYFSARGARTST